MLQTVPLEQLLDTSGIVSDAYTAISTALTQLQGAGASTVIVEWGGQWFAVSAKTLQFLHQEGRGNLLLRDILVTIPPLKVKDFVNIWEVLRLMRCYRVDCLAVVEEGTTELRGVVMLEQVLKFLEGVARPQLSTGWYEYITDTSAEGVFLVDLDLTLLFVNSKLSHLLGYSPGTMEGRNLNEFLVVSEKNGHQEEAQRYFRFLAKDGTDVWAIVVTTPLFDEAGHNIGTLGRISDITERVTRERKDKRKLSALEIAAEGIAILNDRGQFIYVNPSFCQLVQKNEQQLIETDWWSLYGHYRRAPVEVELRQTGRWQGEFLYNDRYIEVSLSTGEEDIICICRDITDRYQAAAALRASEERYRLLAEYATDVIARCNGEGRFEYVSPACQEIWGYTPEELYHRVWFDYIHPEDVARVNLAYQVFLGELDSQRFIYRFWRRDGSYLWMETTARVKRYPDTGVPIEVIMVSRDITETKETEADLIRSREDLRLAVEATTDGLWDWHIPSGEFYCSDRWLEMMGYSRSAWIPHVDSWRQMLHPDDREAVLQQLEEHLTGSSPQYEGEFRLRRADGQYQWVFAKGKVVERDRQGKPVRMVGAHSDINRRKRMEESLRRQYQRALMLEEINKEIRSSLDIQSVLQRTVQELGKVFHQSCAIVQLPLTIYTCDDRLADIDISLLPPSLLATDTVSLIPPAILNLDCPSELAVVRTCYQNECNGLILLCSFTKSYLWYKDDIELLETVAHQVGIAIAQAELLREAQLQSELAQVANRSKSAFLAMMSHEIRTPLNGVIGMAEVLRETDLNPQQAELTSIILESSKTLLSILNDILDFSKIEAGQLTLERQPFDLAETIEAVLTLMGSLVYSKKLELIYDRLLDVDTTVVGDASRLRQVVLNLVSNAIKFCSAGQIVVTLDRWQNFWLITVTDTGIGIDPDQWGDLFQPFSQLNASTTRDYGGTGLGLAISKLLVELMEGYIWGESNESTGGYPPPDWQYRHSLAQGCSFYIAIPSNQPSPLPAPLPIQKRAAVVVPNPDLRGVLTKWLTSWGMTVVTEDTIPYQNCDVVFVDEQLLQGEVWQSGSPGTIPIVVLQPPLHQPQGYSLLKPLKPQACRYLLEQIFMSIAISPSPSPIVCQPLSPLRVLIVEDNPVNQKVAQKMLQRLGYNPTIAKNGTEALHRLQQQDYDIVLMDVQMPEMDGLTATQRIRQECRHQPYIIAITANAMRGDRETCLAAGMDDYLSKPITIESLGEALRRATLK
ncbi:MAG: PAS domain S-box protein [Pseudanabaenaceae cyanobacterium SKYGB_i_bin29]|nr:PAS domain S-box protein [Pseudanabaenaceae cyanobacterium SKYG29]MDW8421969.1 PAS domain S-box protein [Pseudanabaenaceae cyanobacterium SKYGB_i_bin29]